jgi:hypothetical protein
MFHSLMNFMLSPLHYIVNLKSHDWSDFFIYFFIMENRVFLTIFGSKYMFVHSPTLVIHVYVFSLYNALLIFVGGLGGYMCYGLHGHNLFHICEDGLKGVTFYYTKPKYKKQMSSNLKGI